MATAPVFNDLQSINPSAIIELFALQLSTAIHGTNTVYRFHNGSSLNANGEIVWAGNSYIRFPVKAEGFAFQRGQLPRPTLTISNLSSAPSISALLLSVNQTTPGNDLTGATVTRIRTLAKFLDDVNFAPTTTTTPTQQTVVDPSDIETVTYTVTVVNVSGSNYFAINGSTNPVLTMKRGSTYIFNQSHSSNVNHPLRIKSDAGGLQSTTNAGTLGTDATVTYQPVYPSAPNDLRYYCSTHGNAMGNTLTMNNPNTITQTVNVTTTTSTGNPFGTPDPTAEFPQEIYYIDRKSTETRDIVTWELAAVFDLVGIRIPKRQCTRSEFPSIGTFR